MDASKITSEVSNFFNRTVQRAEEAFSTSEKTAIDSNIEELSQACKTRQKWSSKLFGFVESIAEPNPANRVEDKVLQSLDRKKNRSNEYLKLGESLVSIGEQLGSNSPAGSVTIKVGECQNTMGKALLDFQQNIDPTYAAWLRNYEHTVCKAALNEVEKLENCRLDLDRAKNLLKRSKNDAAKKQDSESHTPSEKHEQQVGEAQSAYDRQAEVAKSQLQQCISEFDDGHGEALKKLVNAQREYHEACLKALKEALN